MNRPIATQRPARLPHRPAALILRMLSLALPVLLTACASQIPSSTWQKAPLYGMVYDADGLPLRNVLVYVDERAAALSDSNGRFILADLARGSHELVLEKAGMETLVQEIEFLERGDILYVRMYSTRQLLVAALDSWRHGDTGASQNYAERALQLAPERLDTRYLLALVLVRSASSQTADLERAGDLLAGLRLTRMDARALELLAIELSSAQRQQP
jgi:hypothetical protein